MCKRFHSVFITGSFNGSRISWYVFVQVAASHYTILLPSVTGKRCVSDGLGRAHKILFHFRKDSWLTASTLTCTSVRNSAFFQSISWFDSVHEEESTLPAPRRLICAVFYNWMSSLCKWSTEGVDSFTHDTSLTRTRFWLQKRLRGEKLQQIAAKVCNTTHNVLV